MELCRSSPNKQYKFRCDLVFKFYKWLSTLKILSTFVGTMAGESVGAIPVNSSAKLLTSNSPMIRGTNGARTTFLATSSQFKHYRWNWVHGIKCSGQNNSNAYSCNWTYSEIGMLFKFHGIQRTTTQSSTWILRQQLTNKVFYLYGQIFRNRWMDTQNASRKKIWRVKYIFWKKDHCCLVHRSYVHYTALKDNKI